MKKVLKIIGVLLVLLIIAVAATGVYVKTVLPDVGPPEDIKIEQTAERLERGRYLANHVTVCMDCHSTRDWSRFSGPLAGGDLGGGGEMFDQKMGFPGSFHAKNITPAALGSWTDGEIFRAITTGVSKDGTALFPIMQYPHYGQMSREDLYSIIVYIRTLQPVAHEIPAANPDFPVNFLINTFPARANFGKLPPEEDRLNYGRYLVNAAACVDCHSMQEKGRIVPGTEFGGGMEFHQPAGIVRTPNITPDIETGIGSWNMTGFVQRFKMYADSNYALPELTPEDLNSPMPWTMYAGMSRSDLEAIYTYLQSLKPISHEVIKYEKRRG